MQLELTAREHKEDEDLVDAESAAEFCEFWKTINADKVPVASQAIRRDLDAVFFREGGFYEGGETYSERKIEDNVRAYQMLVAALLIQIKPHGNEFAKRRLDNAGQFKNSARTLLKTMQEVLSPGFVKQFFSRDEINKQSLGSLIDQVVIDPRKITDTLLENLGLDEHVLKGNGVRLPGSAKMVLRALAIPKIKEFFKTSLRPLFLDPEKLHSIGKQNYFRLCRISEGENKGLVLGTEQKNGNKRLFKTDLNGAARRIAHIHEGYKQEIEQLQEVIDEFNQALRLANKWPEMKDSDDVQELLKRISSIADRLKNVQNIHKKDIFERFDRITSFEDKKGRQNPSSRLAILSPAVDSVGKRLYEISVISGYLASDYTRILSYLKGLTNGIARFKQTVDDKSEKLRILDVHTPIEDEDRKRIAANIKILIALLEEVKFQPYMLMAETMKEELIGILPILENGNEDLEAREEAKKAFIRVYSLAKMVEAERMLIDIREEFFKPGYKPESIYRKNLKARIENIEKMFKEKISSDTKLDRYRDIYGATYKFLGKLRGLVCTTFNPHLSQEDINERLIEIDKRLKEFSLLNGNGGNGME